MGAVTAKIKKRLPSGGGVLVDLTLSSSYATNGDSLPWTNADVILCGGGDTGYLISVDHTNSKLKAYRQNAATGAFQEVPNTTDLSAVITRALVYLDAPAA